MTCYMMQLLCLAGISYPVFMYWFIKKFFTNSDGKIIVLQPPNIPIIGWFIAFVVYRLIDQGSVKDGLAFLSSAFLFVWAYLELTQGSSPFRRLLGFIVILFISIPKFT